MAKALALIALLIPSIAHAGNCGHFFAVKQVVAVAPVYAAPIYYQAGVGIEQDALAAKVARIVVGQLRAELNAPQQIRQQQTRPSALAQHCAKCHSGANPKAGVVLDGSTGIACFQITAALRAISTDTMPKDHKLTPDQKGAVMQELLDLEADRPTRPAEVPPPLPSGELK